MELAAHDKTRDKILKMVEHAKSPEKLNQDSIDEYLDSFQNYECWQPYLDLLSSQIADSSQKSQAAYIASIKTLGIHLNRFDEAISLCKKMILDLNISFETFFERVLPVVTLKNDYSAKANFLKSLAKTFKNKKQKVNCLEQLCMIYDKKIFKEQQLNDTYSQILQLDSENIKALRYFKSVQTQAGSWSEVATTLKKLLASVKHKQEEYRVAHELAGIYLYQLGLPHESIEILESYRSQSPLDTSTILYDAHASLKNWRGCLDTLKSCIVTNEEADITAILLYRIGQLHNQINEPQEAFDSFQKASDLWPEFLEPLEEMIHLCVEGKKWHELSLTLRALIEKTQGEEQKRTIQSMYHAVEGCLNELDH